MTILVTGAAGFIGYFLVSALLERGENVIGLDNINDYYDPTLKYSRLETLGVSRNELKEGVSVQSSTHSGYRFVKMDLVDKECIDKLFKTLEIEKVCHLAAQAGVRYSIDNPDSYIQSNIVGFMNILEACRHNNVKNLCYASSSSVYGLNKKVPFETTDNVDHPISLYAATKKSNELMAHTYSHLFGIQTTGLRFFTVYGPFGRPDMAYFKFVKRIIDGKAIDVYNYGNQKRDFTYIDDIVEGIIRVIDNPAKPDPNNKISSAPYRVYNIGNNSPVDLMAFIEAIEKELGKQAVKNYLPAQPGDVAITWANVDPLIEDLSYKPSTPLETGVKSFVSWYEDYYKV